MNVSQNCAVDSITSLIQSHVPDARMDRTDNGAEVMFMLPLNSVSKFAGRFVCIGYFIFQFCFHFVNYMEYESNHQSMTVYGRT